MAKIENKDIIEALKEKTILEVKELVDMMKEEFGVDPSAVAVAAAPAAAESEDAGASTKTVVLKSAGTQKLQVIKLIRGSKSDEEAKAGLMSKFGLSEIQSDAILEMKLRRLTGLERDKIENELNDLLEKIKDFKAILASDERIFGIIK